MFRNMVTSFLSHEKITTTDAKAKELRSIAEKMITFGKKGDLNSMRIAAAYIRDKKVVSKLFTAIAPRYKERNGGYTRIVKLGIRPGDNAPLSMIELVEEEMEAKPVKKPAKKPAKKSAASTDAPKAKATRAPRKAKAAEVPAVEEAPLEEKVESAAETTEES
jgi:large subunit ribosomal protein L17